MESVFQYRLPVWHPQAVHFPVALLLMAALVAVVWLFHDRATWRTMLLILLAAGAAGGVVAYQTGETLLDAVEGTPVVEALVDAHESAAINAILTAGLGTVALALYVVVRRRRGAYPSGDPLWIRLAFLLVALTAAGWVAWTAHIGGTMVWGVPR